MGGRGRVGSSDEKSKGFDSLWLGLGSSTSTPPCSIGISIACVVAVLKIVVGGGDGNVGNVVADRDNLLFLLVAILSLVAISSRWSSSISSYFLFS